MFVSGSGIGSKAMFVSNLTRIKLGRTIVTHTHKQQRKSRLVSGAFHCSVYKYLREDSTPEQGQYLPTYKSIPCVQTRRKSIDVHAPKMLR